MIANILLFIYYFISWWVVYVVIQDARKEGFFLKWEKTLLAVTFIFGLIPLIILFVFYNFIFIPIKIYLRKIRNIK